MAVWFFAAMTSFLTKRMYDGIWVKTQVGGGRRVVVRGSVAEPGNGASFALNCFGSVPFWSSGRKSFDFVHDITNR